MAEEATPGLVLVQSSNASLNAMEDKEGTHHEELLSNPRSSLMDSFTSYSQFGQVIFHDVDDIYPTDCDIYCKYTLTESVQFSHGDRIGLFKVGWTKISDVIAFKLAPIPLSEKEYSTLHVTFTANLLPKEETEFYQLCYITSDERVIGASTPFQFRRPLENDIVYIDDKPTGLVVCKSRVARLHDKIANLEENKVMMELKVHTLKDKVSIIEKELASVTKSNEFLSLSLSHAQEDVRLLTKKLEIEKEESVKSRALLSAVNIELHNTILDREKISFSLTAAQNELNKTSLTLDRVRQDHMQAELTLREVTAYNATLKNEVDELKQRNGVLMIEDEARNNAMMNIQSRINELQLENQKLIELNSEANASDSKKQVASAPPESLNMAFTQTEQSLRIQLQQALDVLDETLQDQTSTQLKAEKNAKQVSQLEDKCKQYSESLGEREHQIVHLKKIVAEKEEINRSLQNEYNEFLRKSSAETQETKEKMDALTAECTTLKSKLTEFKQKGDSPVNEELREVITNLQQAFITEPTFEAYYKIFMESTRVTAMNTYKPLFQSVQSLDLGNAEFGMKVRQLLDEFCILNQDLCRCRQELKDRIIQNDKIRSDLQMVSSENETNKIKVIELEETVNELSSCLGAIKKDGCDVQEVSKLKADYEEMKMKYENIEKQLKDAKVANALTNIGQVTYNQSSLTAEIERLRSRIRSLELQQSLPRTCCEDLRNRLKQSAKEYAKLYRQLEFERIPVAKPVVDARSIVANSVTDSQS